MKAVAFGARSPLRFVEPVLGLAKGRSQGQATSRPLDGGEEALAAITRPALDASLSPTEQIAQSSHGRGAAILGIAAAMMVAVVFLDLLAWIGS